MFTEHCGTWVLVLVWIRTRFSGLRVSPLSAAVALKPGLCLSWRLRKSGRDWSESLRVWRCETEQTTGQLFFLQLCRVPVLDVPDNHGVIRRAPLPAVQALERYNWVTFAFLILETRSSPACCLLSELLLISTVREINLVLHGVGIELSGARSFALCLPGVLISSVGDSVPFGLGLSLQCPERKASFYLARKSLHGVGRGVVWSRLLCPQDGSCVPLTWF